MTDRIILGVMLVLGTVYFYATAQIPFLEIGDLIGPKAFPRLLGAGLFVSAAMLLLEMRRAPKSARDDDESVRKTERPKWGLLCAVVVWTTLYAATFEVLGFVVATSIFLLVCTACFNRGRWTANVVTSLLFSVGSYLLFKYLGVSLPAGLLPF